MQPSPKRLSQTGRQRNSGLGLFRRSRLLLLALYLLAVIPAQADPVPSSYWWLGNTNNLWNGQNWASSAAGAPTGGTPASGSNVTFSATGATNKSVQLNVDTTINSLLVADTISLTPTTGQTHTLTLGGTTTIGLENAAALGVTSGTFTINSGVTLNVATGKSSVIISGSGTTPTLTLNGGTLSGPTNGIFFVRVGDGGKGTLNVDNGGTITQGLLQIGLQNGDVGTVTVNGTGSSINSSEYLLVGSAGAGTLNVQNGAVVTTPSLIVADNNSSTSSAIVTGKGSQLNATNIYIDEGGNGTLRVLNGGTVSSTNAYLAQEEEDNAYSLVSGASSVWNTKSIIVGQDGPGQLTINNGGAVNVDGGAGTVTLAQNGSSSGTLTIGSDSQSAGPTTSGTLNAAVVTGGSGTASVVFSQTNNFTFTPQITGSISVTHNGPGTTTLAQANTYTGGTTVNGGTLLTQNSSALGTGSVFLQGGTLRAVGTLNIGTPQSSANLVWQSTSAQIALAPGQGDVINVNGNFTPGKVFKPALSTQSPVPGSYVFAIDPAGMALNQPYVLVNYNSTDFTLGQFSAVPYNSSLQFTYEFITGPGAGVNNPAPGAAGSGSVEIELLSETSTVTLSDGLLHNFDNGVFPTANYIVNGTIYSGRNAAGQQEPYTFINALLVTPGGTLIIPSVNILTIATDLTVNAGNVFIYGGLHTLGNVNINPGSQLILEFGSFMNVGGTVNLYGNTFTNVNGVLTSPFVHIHNGAFLEGKGTIVGNVYNSGIVGPGNSPGTLTIQGNYTQGSSGTLQIQIASPHVYDHLIVSGTAKLGGTLQVQSLGANLAWGQEYSFLKAGKTVGSFDQIEMPDPALFRGRLIQDGNSEVLLIAPASYTLFAQNPNEFNVARALDRWIGSANKDVSAVTLALDLLPVDQLSRAFAAISPAYYSLLPSTSIEQSISHVQLLDQRLGQLRAGATGFNFAGTSQCPSSGEGDKSTKDTKEPAVAIANDLRWGGFLQITGQFADVQTLQNLGDNHFNTVGALGGIDYRVDAKTVVGLAAGYEYTNLNYSAGDRTTMDDFRVSGYGNYKLGDGFFLNGIVGGAFTKYDVKRPIDFGTIDRTAAGNTRGSQFYSALELGKDIDWGHWTFTPSAAFQYTYLSISGLTEQDAGVLNLHVNRQSTSSYRTQLGAQAAYHIETTSGAIFTPYVSAYWEHEFSSEAASLEATLPDGGGAFNYAGTPMQRDRMLAGVGVMVDLSKNTNLNLGYQADFASSTYTSHFIYLQVGVKF